MFLALSGDTTLSQAVANTVMGICIVFLILIFIMCIIYLMKFIPIIVDKFSGKGKKEEQADVSRTEPSQVKTEAAADNSQEIAAVIAAAIAAASESTGTSKDSLVVRSIRRLR